MSNTQEVEIPRPVESQLEKLRKQRRLIESVLADAKKRLSQAQNEVSIHEESLSTFRETLDTLGIKL